MFSMFILMDGMYILLAVLTIYVVLAGLFYKFYIIPNEFFGYNDVKKRLIQNKYLKRFSMIFSLIVTVGLLFILLDSSGASKHVEYSDVEPVVINENIDINYSSDEVKKEEINVKSKADQKKALDNFDKFLK